MSHFPESVSKTQWQRMGSGARLAAAQALLASYEVSRSGGASVGGTIALLRGLPERPVWKRSEPTAKHCDLLIKRAKRKLGREQKEMVHRSRVLQKSQQACQHVWQEHDGLSTRNCTKCGAIG